MERIEDVGRYLYRALRREEIDAGIVLLPKGQGPFLSEPMLGLDTRLPFRFGPAIEHATRQHQFAQNGFPTSGISTTPHLERARFYARNRVIVKIDRLLLATHGIDEVIVKELIHMDDVACPEDDEVILVNHAGNPLPKEIIVDLIFLNN